MNNPLRFGVRRRCWWCGVVLRGWQLNSCRMCKNHIKVDKTSPPCRHMSRIEDEPDEWKGL